LQNIWFILNKDSLFRKEAFNSWYESLKDDPLSKNINYFNNDKFAIGLNSIKNSYSNIKFFNRYFIVFQGRIDNKKELENLVNFTSNNLSNDELVLSLYLKFGKEFSKYILGDWSFIIYDSKKDEAFFARDHFGITALYYYNDNDICIVSSSIKPLLNYKKIKKTIDLDKIISISSTIKISNWDNSFFNEIKQVNPAYQVTISNKNINIEKYWEPHKNLELNTKISQDEAVEELTKIFDEAVRCRITSENIACELSGGLDSSSVTSFTSKYIKTVNTFSHVPYTSFSNKDYLYDNSNETKYIKKTVGYLGNITPHYLDSKNISIFDGIKKSIEILDEPLASGTSAYWNIDILENVKNSDCDTLFNGKWGNGTISFNYNKEFIPKKEYYLKNGLYLTLRNKLIKPNYFLFKNLMKKKNSWTRYSYLSEEFVYSNNLVGKLSKTPFNSYFKLDIDNKDLQINILQLKNGSGLINMAKFGQYYDIQRTDPTGDVRLIEFLLSLPSNLYIGPNGEKKYLLKKMMNGHLPNEVLYQKGKCIQNGDMIGRLHSFDEFSFIKEYISDYHIDTQYDIFDKVRLLKDIENLKQDRKPTQQSLRHVIRSMNVMMFLEHAKKYI